MSQVGKRRLPSGPSRDDDEADRVLAASRSPPTHPPGIGGNEWSSVEQLQVFPAPRSLPRPGRILRHTLERANACYKIMPGQRDETGLTPALGRDGSISLTFSLNAAVQVQSFPSN